MSEPFQFGPFSWGDEGKPKPEYKEPTGRHLCCGMDAEMKPFADGDWVPYADYARLKAEVERLTIERNGFEQAMKANQSILETKREENEALRNLAIKLDGYVDLVRHENNRLRKAGDGLYGIAYNAGPGEGRVEKLDAWRAAKEGKPSDA